MSTITPSIQFPVQLPITSCGSVESGVVSHPLVSTSAPVGMQGESNCLHLMPFGSVALDGTVKLPVVLRQPVWYAACQTIQ